MSPTAAELLADDPPKPAITKLPPQRSYQLATPDQRRRIRKALDDSKLTGFKFSELLRVYVGDGLIDRIPECVAEDVVTGLTKGTLASEGLPVVERMVGPTIIPADAVDFEVPRELPKKDNGYRLQQLSISSTNKLRECPEKWRRHYLMGEREPSKGAFVPGNAIGAALNRTMQNLADGFDPYKLPELSDIYRDEFAYDIEARGGPDKIIWKRNHGADKLVDWGAQALDFYYKTIFEPMLAEGRLNPIATERRVEMQFEGADWYWIGYVDLEESDGLSDYKVGGKLQGDNKTWGSTQGLAYRYARQLEDNPADRFSFHSIRLAGPRSQPDAEVTDVVHPDAMLATVPRRIAAAAREMTWRSEQGIWDGPKPGEWWCTEGSCGYYSVCPLALGRPAAA